MGGSWWANAVTRRGRGVVAAMLTLVIAIVPTIGSSVASAQTGGSVPLLSRVVGYVENADGVPLEGIEVEVASYYFYGEGEPPSGAGVTDVDGQFAIDITSTPPDGGGLQLRVTDPNGFYGFQVTEGFFIQPGYDHVVGITMVEGGNVSGTVSSAGSPLPDVCVDVYRYGDDESIPVGSYCTAPDGSYDTGALDPNRYGFVTYVDGYFEAFEEVIVTSGSPTTLDFDLVSRTGAGSASVTVDVVSAADGTPVASCASVYDSSFVFIAGSCSASGTVTLVGLQPGTYVLNTSANDGRHLSAGSFTSVTLVGGANDVQVTVPLGGMIEGTVTGADGTTPLAGVRVQLCNFFGCSSGTFGGDRFALTDSDGRYRFEGLYPGNEYKVQFSGLGYATQFWDETPAVGESGDFASGAVVQVPTSVRSGIDARMSTVELFAISGVVADSVSGLSIADATVRVRRVVNGNLLTVAAVPTASDGSYTTTALEAGTYQVSVAAIGYVSERYDDVKNGSGAVTPVVVGPGSPAPEVSFDLDPQGVVRGGVTTDLPPVRAHGYSGAYYCVTATPVNVEFAPVSDCASIGAPYRLAKLPAGEYTVEVTSSDYLTQGGISLVIESVLGGDTETLDFTLVRKPLISGTVLDASAQPALNVSVCALAGGILQRCGYTQDDGTYSFVVDEPGNYTIQAQGYQYVSEWYPNLAVQPAEPNVAVDATGAAGIDFTLDRLPQITIVAVDETGSPACGVPVKLYDATDTPVVTTTAECYSQPAATLTFSAAPGTYRLGFGGFTPWSGQAKYAEEFWENQPSLATAAGVSLALNSVSTFAVTVAALPVVTGVVTSDAPGGAPLSSVAVAAYPADTDGFGSPIATVYTNFAGAYRLALPEGSYKLRFQQFRHLTEWWDDAELLADASDVVVASADVVANASLEPLIAVSGRVTVDGSPGTGIQSAYIEFWRDDVSLGWGYTSADGTYTAFVRAGSYKVYVSKPGFAGEWYDDQASRAAATPVVVTDTTTGIDIALTQYPRISGTVVDDDTGLPVQGVFVRALFGSGSEITSTITDSAGNYSVGVPPAEVVLEFDGGSVGYVGEYFDGQRTFGAATLVDVRSGDQIAGASLARGGSISGTLRDATGAATTGCVYAHPSLEPGSTWTRYDCTDMNGFYRIDGLRPGDYDVAWFASSTVWYDGATQRSGATPVTVVVGSEQTGIDLSPPTGRTLSGVVTDESGGPIVGASVVASGPSSASATTRADGSFTVYLPDFVGNYQVRISAAGYVSEYFDDARTAGSPGFTFVSVASADVDLGQIDLAVPSVNVSGTILEDGTTDPVGSACVEFHELNGFNYQACADGSGVYSINLPSNGSYRVRLFDSAYPRRFLQDVPYNFGNPLAVATTDLVEDFTMARGFRASGRVVVDGTTVGLPGIQVRLYNEASGSYFYGYTTFDGSFVSDPMPPGSYSVRFENFGGRYIAEYLGGGFTSPGDPLVIVDADVNGVDAALAAGAIVSGIVSDQDASPLSGVCVVARFAGSPDVLASSCTNADGEYATPGLPDGSIELSVNDGRFEPFTTVIDIVGGVDLARNIILERPIVPEFVQNLTATPRPGGVMLTWEPPIYPTGLVGYEVLLFDGVAYAPYATTAETSLVVSGLPSGVRQYLAVRTNYSDGSVGPDWYIDATPSSVTTPVDFDGNGSADRSIFRPEVGGWYVEGQDTVFIGLAGDVPVPADYDGDGVVDQAVFRDGVWYIEGQSPQFLGLAGDTPVPGDYDGDGVSEVAVFRAGEWFIDGQATAYFGLAGDIPVPADYDGDGTIDLAVYRPAVGGWYVEGLAPEFFGFPSDVPVPADYDGDGATDRAVYRPEYGGWYVQGQETVFLGLSEDVPVPADYDGDGAAERAVYRPQYGGWYVEGQATAFYGLGTDIPLPLPASVYNRFYSPTP